MINPSRHADETGGDTLNFGPARTRPAGHYWRAGSNFGLALDKKPTSRDRAWARFLLGWEWVDNER